MHISLLRHLFYPFKPRRRDVKVKLITIQPFFSRSTSRDFIALICLCMSRLLVFPVASTTPILFNLAVFLSLFRFDIVRFEPSKFH